MKAILYLLNASLSLLVGAFLLRFLLQIVGANFRNPVVEIITKLTNPIILPLRKILPPIQKIDSASVIACLLASIFMVMVMLIALGNSLSTLFANPLDLVGLGLRNLFSLLLTLYWILILFSILLSWIQPGNHSPFTSIIHQLTEPLFAPFRRIIPPLGGLDITPIPVLLILGALQQQFKFALY